MISVNGFLSRLSLGLNTHTDTNNLYDAQWRCFTFHLVWGSSLHCPVNQCIKEFHRKDNGGGNNLNPIPAANTSCNSFYYTFNKFTNTFQSIQLSSSSKGQIYFKNEECNFFFLCFLNRTWLFGGSLPAGKWPFPASRQRGLQELIKNSQNPL